MIFADLFTILQVNRFFQPIEYEVAARFPLNLLLTVIEVSSDFFSSDVSFDCNYCNISCLSTMETASFVRNLNQTTGASRFANHWQWINRPPES